MIRRSRRWPAQGHSEQGDARAVFSAFVERNAERAHELFDQVAENDPAKALDLLARISEFAVPKPARTELAGPEDGKPVSTINVRFVSAPERAEP